MNGIDAMIKLFQGKVVKCVQTGQKYAFVRTEDSHTERVAYTNECPWHDAELTVSEWFDMEFIEVPEYDLTFPEAIERIYGDMRVKSILFDDLTFYMNDEGTLLMSKHTNGICHESKASFSEEMVENMWKVEEEIYSNKTDDEEEEE